MALARTCLVPILKIERNRLYRFTPCLPHPADHTWLPDQILCKGSQSLRSGGALGGPRGACVKVCGK